MRFFRSAIEKMEGYVPGFQPKDVGFIKLNTNENPYPPSPRVLKVLSEALGSNIRLYPDPMSDVLRDRIGSVFNVPRDWVIAGNGSDELLDMIVRTAVGENDSIFVTDPTYILYEVLAGFQEAKILRCKLDENFNLPNRIELGHSKLVIISNPNTPTGTLLSQRRIIEICKKAKGLVVVDEAYVDFATDTCLGLVKRFENLVVTRSFSKSFSLAGLRLGFGIAQPRVIETLMKVKDSYNVNRLSQLAGCAALEDLGWMKKNVQRIIRDREFLTQNLMKMGFEVLPSQANFIFVKHPRCTAEKLYRELYARKILVRHFNVPRLKIFLRISIGTHQDTVILVRAIEEILTLKPKLEGGYIS